MQLHHCCCNSAASQLLEVTAGETHALMQASATISCHRLPPWLHLDGGGQSSCKGIRVLWQLLMVNDHSTIQVGLCHQGGCWGSGCSNQQGQESDINKEAGDQGSK
jgi:hypothetical protein